MPDFKGPAKGQRGQHPTLSSPTSSKLSSSGLWSSGTGSRDQDSGGQGLVPEESMRSRVGEWLTALLSSTVSEEVGKRWRPARRPPTLLRWLEVLAVSVPHFSIVQGLTGDDGRESVNNFIRDGRINSSPLDPWRSFPAFLAHEPNWRF